MRCVHTQEDGVQTRTQQHDLPERHHWWLWSTHVWQVLYNAALPTGVRAGAWCGTEHLYKHFQAETLLRILLYATYCEGDVCHSHPLFSQIRCHRSPTATTQAPGPPSSHWNSKETGKWNDNIKIFAQRNTLLLPMDNLQQYSRYNSPNSWKGHFYVGT